MGATPVCQITDLGCIRPDFDACLAYFQSAYRGIYGQDVYLGADSQDGQFMTLLANALHDANGETLAAYNAFSPATAQGAGLSSVVKINGIRRKSATYSTVDVIVSGQVGAIIADGIVRDASGNQWSLPSQVVIPAAGQILVTATCRTIGAVASPAGSLSTIATPTLGWQSVINPAAGAVGLPVETDSQLRQRQALSTALPALTPLESLQGALLAISGVVACKIYENDDNAADANGVPGHAIAVVIQGGDADLIAQVIKAKKSPGVGTYGDVFKPLSDAYGISHPYRFFRPKITPIAWYVSVRARQGYTADVASTLRTALADYTNMLGIGTNQSLSGAYPAANLSGTAQAVTYEVVGLKAARTNATNDAYGDVVCAYNERLVCDPADVKITVVPA